MKPTQSPHVDSLSLTHYRTDDATYFDTRWADSELTDLGWQAQLAWFRILSGSEMTRDGFPMEAVPELFDSREFPTSAAIESLLRAKLLVKADGHLVVPNLVWGEPPTLGGASK